MCKYVVLMILCCAYVIQRGICQLEVECGIVAPEAEPLVINGRAVKGAEFPWHVGLYDKSSKRIQLICGGTIVGAKLVVTAAHCVYKDGVGPYPAFTFAVAAGKIYRLWNAPADDEKYVQKIDVTEIKIPELYKGAVNSYTADIAMLVLKKSFMLNSFVRPVCIKFDNEDNLTGQYGRVAGWGLTEEGGHASSILQTARLPIVSFEDCYNNSPEGFRSLIIHDKICAGYTNGTALCKGDSGGGLVFSRRNGIHVLYYLYGIVSTSPRNQAMTSCSAYAYTAFTDFIKHQKWFQDIWIIQTRKELTEVDLAKCTNTSGKNPEFCKGYSTGLTTTERPTEKPVTPTTQEHICILPLYPNHGKYRTTRGYKPNDAVSYTMLTYSCDRGYRLEGHTSVYCYTGTWSSKTPTCEKLTEVDLAKCTNTSGKNPEFCKGYGTERTPTEELNIQERKCILPQYPDHGKYTTTHGAKPDDAISNDVLTYSCDRGYRLEGLTSVYCYTGTWSSKTPTCEKLTEVDLAKCTNTSGENPEFCKGYSTGLTTTERPTEKPVTPIIQERKCILPQYPDHGNYRTTRGSKPNDAVSHAMLTYSCDKGYHLEGLTSVYCYTGTWSSKTPTCERDGERAAFTFFPSNRP